MAILSTDERSIAFEDMAASFCGAHGTILESFALYNDGELVYESDDRAEYEQARKQAGGRR